MASDRPSSACPVPIPPFRQPLHRLHPQSLKMASKPVQSSDNTIKCNDIGNRADLVAYYDDIAQTYDKVVNDQRGYVAPHEIPKILDKFLKSYWFTENCRILDVGSGTGLTGEGLYKLGYKNIDAFDPSEKSHELARAKNVYTNYITDYMEVGRKLNIRDNEYDAILCVGVFTKGHVTADAAMDEMVRVVKSNGLICFSIREDVMYDKHYGYEKKMEELCEKKCWELVEKNIAPYHNTGDLLNCYAFTYKVL